MSNLLENILNKNQKINFDFSKSYNRQNPNNVNYYNRESFLPIEPETSSWETIEDGYEHLKKQYVFKTDKHLMYFVNQTLKESFLKNHSPNIKITNKIVEVILFTEDVNSVTEVDIELSKIFDEIYEDIFYIHGF